MHKRLRTYGLHDYMTKMRTIRVFLHLTNFRHYKRLKDISLFLGHRKNIFSTYLDAAGQLAVLMCSLYNYRPTMIERTKVRNGNKIKINFSLSLRSNILIHLHCHNCLSLPQQFNNQQAILTRSATAA